MMKKSIIIFSLMFLAPWAFTSEKWQGIVNAISVGNSYLLVSDLSCEMTRNISIVSSRGTSMTRYDLREGQKVEVTFDRGRKRLASSITVFPSNHVFEELED